MSTISHLHPLRAGVQLLLDVQRGSLPPHRARLLLRQDGKPAAMLLRDRMGSAGRGGRCLRDRPGFQ